MEALCIPSIETESDKGNGSTMYRLKLKVIEGKEALCIPHVMAFVNELFLGERGPPLLKLEGEGWTFT